MSLPAGSYQPGEISFRDAGNEIGRFRLNGPTTDDSSYVANAALWAAVVTKALVMSLGAPTKESFLVETLLVTTQPTNGAARELKLLLQGQDTITGQRLSATIPALDVSKVSYAININAKDVVLLTGPTAMTDLITAVNAFWINPISGNPVHIVGAKVVGRNV